MISQSYQYKSLSQKRLEEILDKISKTKITLIGDVCLDIYWKADMTKSELSRETPHFPLPVVEERMSPGAGGNVASNIKDLNVSDLEVISVIGDDWRGMALKKEFERQGISAGALMPCKEIITNAYCKPLRHGISELIYEDPRIDFCSYNPIPEKYELKLIEKLETAAENSDAVCVCDQFSIGCITEKVREKISELGEKGLTIIADSRDRINLFRNIIIKPNELEAGLAAFDDFSPDKASLDTYREAARILSEYNDNKVCITLGDRGSLFSKKGESTYITGIPTGGEIDICGAGDSFLSAFTCALAVGAKGYEAMALANLAASVTIKKIHTTGTASPAEIMSKYKEI